MFNGDSKINLSIFYIVLDKDIGKYKYNILVMWKTIMKYFHLIGCKVGTNLEGWYGKFHPYQGGCMGWE